MALVYADSDKLAADSVNVEEQMNVLKAEVNKSMPSYSKISKVEVMDAPFEKTPKMSIKRFMYKLLRYYPKPRADFVHAKPPFSFPPSVCRNLNSSTKTPIFMDKTRINRCSSTKTPLFVDDLKL